MILLRLLGFLMSAWTLKPTFYPKQTTNKVHEGNEALPIVPPLIR